ncbi:MAG TPA: hypothetical protein VFB25_11155 [Gaiellaceae bacterium]|nr:hypothetical protein [Gaiellaceae bacterium]
MPGTHAEELRVEPSLVTAVVNGAPASLSAPPIPRGIWAELDVSDPNLAQVLDHTWEEPLIPVEVVEVGETAPLWHAFAEAVDEDPTLLLRWRGYGPAEASDDPWRGGPLPELPAPARRPPESVPKRFGASGIQVGGEDLVEVLIRAYAAFEE